MNHSIKEKIQEIADSYSTILKQKIINRTNEMMNDDKSHFLIYKVLGIADSECELIDNYQNTGRFLYKYAGTFLEQAATICLQNRYPNGSKHKINNSIGVKPKTFEIDFLNGTDAIEIKWRDATTDGDHVTKEHTRIKAISSANLKPIRIMFYYPQREQSKKIQQTLKTLYKGGKWRIL